MNVPDSILAAGFTVFGGAVTFILGQIFVKAVLEPAHELKKEIARVAYSLGFYANQLYQKTPQAEEAQECFRKHACRLRELVVLVLMYDVWRPVFNLPSEGNVMEASSQLIGHSNGCKDTIPRLGKDRGSEIRRRLLIRSIDKYTGESKPLV